MGPRVAVMVVIALSGCDADPIGLFVDLKTDIVPGIEFVSVETEVLLGGNRVDVATRGATRADDFVPGLRIAEVEGLEAGEYLVDVRLIDAQGDLVASRVTRVTLEASFALTVVISRDCLEVTCADVGAEAQACFGGRCVDARCTPERPELCPPPECTADMDCAVAVACAEPRCVDGVCFAEARSERCASTEWCDVDVGCRPLPDEPLDAGVDAGVDAGSAGCDPMCPWSCLGPAECVNARQVSVGNSHACAVDDADQVSCWGNGTGSDTPVFVTSVTARQVSAGELHTCVVTTASTVACWGANMSGQLGDGTATSSSTPVDVPGLVNVSAVSAGQLRSCAQLADGRLFCWGDNGEGALGDGTTSDRSMPTPVSGVNDATILAANGSGHVCAVRGATNALFCWGRGTAGQLGVGDTMDSNVPVAVPGAIGIADVAVGSDHSCALSTVGGAVCWGANSASEVGDGTSIRRLVPTAVLNVINASQITTGISGNHVCAMEAGGARTWCWGANTSGQAGNGSLGGVVSTPTEVVGLSDAVQISAAGDASCAVRAAGGIVCWGEGNLGQLGNGSSDDSGTPIAVLRPAQP